MSNQSISKQQTLGFLRETSIMSVAIIQDNKPLSTVLLFAIDDDFTFYFATIKQSYKAQALEKNNNISLSVWQHHKLLVQANGTVTTTNNEKEAEATLEKIVDAATSLEDFWPPVLQIKGHDYVIYKVTPTWLRVMDLSHKEAVADGSLFTQIIG